MTLAAPQPCSLFNPKKFDFRWSGGFEVARKGAQMDLLCLRQFITVFVTLTCTMTQ